MSLASVLQALPLEDIEAALADPTNLGKEAKVAEDIITRAMPGLEGALVALLVSLFVGWVYSEGGGTITYDPLPMTDAQLHHGGGDLK